MRNSPPPLSSPSDAACPAGRGFSGVVYQQPRRTKRIVAETLLPLDCKSDINETVEAGEREEYSSYSSASKTADLIDGAALPVEAADIIQNFGGEYD